MAMPGEACADLAAEACDMARGNRPDCHGFAPTAGVQIGPHRLVDGPHWTVSGPPDLAAQSRGPFPAKGAAVYDCDICSLAAARGLLWSAIARPAVWGPCVLAPPAGQIALGQSRQLPRARCVRTCASELTRSSLHALAHRALVRLPAAILGDCSRYYKPLEYSVMRWQMPYSGRSLHWQASG